MKTTQIKAQSERIATRTNNLVDIASQKLAQGLDLLNERADELPELGSRVLSNAKQMLSEASKQTRTSPRAAVGIAVLAGLVFAKWILRPTR